MGFFEILKLMTHRCHAGPQVAGGKDESVLQPTWTSGNKLVFISDRSGWWNLYTESAPGDIKTLFPLDAEFAGPAWVFGLRSYVLLSNGRYADI